MTAATRDNAVAAPARDATVIPTLRYRDAHAAIAWLCRAFGFERHLAVAGEDGAIAHAQLTFGNGMIMLASGRPGEAARGAYVVVADVDAHHARALSAGARVTMAPADMHYGGRLYACLDLEGYLWHFGSYDPWA